MADFTPTIAARIQEFLGRDGYRPLKQHELSKALGLKDSADRSELRHALYELERQGLVVCLRKNRWALPDNTKRVTGVIRISAQRFGFVTPEAPGAEEVFVREEGLGTALDGDRVIVCLSSSPGSGSNRRPVVPTARKAEGRVERVLERRRTSVVGLLCRSAYYWYVIADSPRFLHNVRIRDFELGGGKPVEFHKVAVRLDEWLDPGQPLTGVVSEDLGEADAPGVDVVSILRDHQLETEFPSKVVEEASRIPSTPSDDEIAGRQDLRDRMVFTIDPEDAKDFDDAVSLEELPDGFLCLGVHIADVAHYVAPGTELDREAFLRGNSVYLVDRVLPMLPPYLTTEVCSLAPHKDRLTHTVSMRISPDGAIRSFETYRSVIRSSARLTYEQVQTFFDGGSDHGIPAPVLETLGQLRRLARVLRQKRMSAGSIDLTMPEVRCILDPLGRTVAIRKRGATEAYNLIEEMMLSANCVVAGILAESRGPAIYRIHGPPDEEQWAKMHMELQALNISTSFDSRQGLNRVARDAAGTPFAYTINLAILRNLKRAEYSSTLAEHFGLAFDRYTHFTSPIRRYPDLAVHRLLNRLEEHGRPKMSHDDAQRIAEHCSRTERNADDAETESVDVKRIEFYARLLSERQVGPYDAVVTSMNPKGLIVEVTETLQRGMVPYSSMRDDYYVLSDDRSFARGRRHRATWHMGQTLKVCLARVDSRRRLVDFSIAAEEQPPRRAVKGKKSAKGRRIRHK